MSRFVVKRVVDCKAPPETVFALLSDSSSYPSWSTIESYEMERPGFSEPHGVGEIRVLSAGRYRIREEVVEIVPGRTMAYTLLSGLPMRDYRGETTLDPLPGGGTRITWQSSFRGVACTGWFMRLFMGRALNMLTTALSRAAEAATSSAAATTAAAPQENAAAGSMPK